MLFREYHYILCFYQTSGLLAQSPENSSKTRDIWEGCV